MKAATLKQRGYTEGELTLYVRQERLKLERELVEVRGQQRQLANRHREITDRIEELQQAEYLLVEGFS